MVWYLNKLVFYSLPIVHIKNNKLQDSRQVAPPPPKKKARVSASRRRRRKSTSSLVALGPWKRGGSCQGPSGGLRFQSFFSYLVRVCVLLRKARRWRLFPP